MPRKTVSMEEAFQELDAILEKLEGKDKVNLRLK